MFATTEAGSWNGQEEANKSKKASYLVDPGLKVGPVCCQEQIWSGKNGETEKTVTKWHISSSGNYTPHTVNTDEGGNEDYCSGNDSMKK